VASGLDLPFGVGADSSGNVYIADSGNNRVLLETLSGGSYTQTTFADATTNGLNFPEGVAVDGLGNVYISDTVNNREIRFGQQSVNFGSQAVDTASAAQTLNFSIAADTTVGSVAVLTTGVTGLDFASVSGTTCTATTYSSATTCVVNVTFKPAAAGLRIGAVVLADGSGNALAAVPLFGTGTGPQVGYLGAAKTTQSTGYAGAIGIAVDAAGNVYEGNDSTPASVYESTAGGTNIRTITGFNSIHGVAVDGAGDVFVAQWGSPAGLYEVTPNGTQIAVGSGWAGPSGAAVDGAGNVYTTDNGFVYKVTLAGTKTAVGSGFTVPVGVAVDAAGNVYVSDAGNFNTGNGAGLYKVTPGGTTTKVNGTIESPESIAIDAAGDLFTVAGNAVGADLVELTAAGDVVTAGTGFDYPVGVATDGQGNVYVTNYYGGSISKLDRVDAPSVSFATATNVGTTDTTDGTKKVQVVNLGNQPLDFTALTYPADFSEATGDASACAGTTSLIPGEECDVPIEFTPENDGSPLSEAVKLTDNALNATGAQQSIPVSGTSQGAVLTSQTITFTAITGTHIVGGTVTLSATASSGLPVSFISTNSAICTVSGITATLVAGGSCDIEARQWGNSTYAVAPFAFQIFWVNHKTQTISFPAIAFNQNADTTLPLSATATSGLAVTFTSLTPATCTVTGTTASLNHYGYCTIETSQPGNGVYGEAAHIDQTIFIHHLTQTIAFGAISSQTVGTPLTLSATASSGLTVGFSSLTPLVCTVSGATATFIKAGTCSVEAAQPGNTVYGNAPVVKQSFTVRGS
jgi:hypothetical protein